MWPPVVLALVTSCWQDHEQKQSFWVVWGIWMIDGFQTRHRKLSFKKKSHLLAYLCRIKMWIRPALEEKLVKKKYLVMSPSLIQHFVGSVPCDRHPIDRHTPKTRPCPQRTGAQMPLMTRYEDQVQTLAKSLASSSFPTFLSWASFAKWLNTISPPNSCRCSWFPCWELEKGLSFYSLETLP